ncbi:hypothetical protein UFOVP157_15 [uncultured Caudovirales phage]|uniref:Uncharacterized protein n=1 Tax=uncultured Caudovirales phage TaxID=2100421 RepID=A0A6J7W9E1_9CAUD|nr:hypothetical protein UFOVP157_15 [uncultured Caudovirales phage]
MNTDESSDLGTESNNPSNNDSKPLAMSESNLADFISKKFLGGEEQAAFDAPKTEETPVEVEATTDDENTVHSQENEDTTPESEEPDSEETEETKSDEDETERGLPKGVKKRIDKLSAKRREAEAEVERLKSEVERLSLEANKPAQTPTADNPYANLGSIEEVNREADQAKQIRRWCEMNPDGAVVKNKDGSEVEYTSEEIRNIKIRAMDALEEHLPKRAQYLQNYNQIEQVAQKEYPWWKDKAARERQMAETFIKAFPEIQKFPDYKMVIGDYIRGVKSREMASKKPAPAKAPSAPRMSASPTQVSKNDANAQVAKQRYISKNSTEDLASIIASKFL